MSKSSKKKRRQAAKRRKQQLEMEKIRGVSLLDTASPGFLKGSPSPLKEVGISNGRGEDYSTKVSASTDENNLHDLVAPRAVKASTIMPTQLPIGSEGLARKRVEFVLPRLLGRNQSYVFEKQSRKSTNTEKLHATGQAVDERVYVSEGEEKRHRPDESIDDILFSTQKRKLEEKFEAIHREENAKSYSKAQTTNQVTCPTSIVECTSTAKKKRKRKRKFSIDFQQEEARRVSKNDDSQYVTTQTDQSSLPLHKEQIGAVDNERDNHHHSVGEKLVKTSSDKSADVRHDTTLKHSHVDSHTGQLSGRSVEEAVNDKHGLRPRSNSTDGELNLPQGGLCDERMVLQAHRWVDELNYVHQVIPRGFVNLGNTCFLNSILQCLAYLPPFCQTLVAMGEARMKQKNGVNGKLDHGQRVTSSLCSLFQRVHGFNDSAIHEGAIAPQAIVRALPSLGAIGSRNGYKFRPGRQEDAHEFLVHLLDAMHDGELRAAGINQHISGWRDLLPVSRLDETTFIHRIFCGYFRSQLQCRKCGYQSNTYDPFLDLSLEVSKPVANSVLKALSEFTRKEILDSDNRWKCSGCKKYVCPTKQLTVFRPPLSLCIQLKRFSFDGGFGARGYSSYGTAGWKYGKTKFSCQGGSKITKPIEFPADLNLPLSDGRSCAYTLTGVVIHEGGSANSGHYTAYVKKPGRKGINQWYHADDSFVEPVSEKTVLKQKDAYVLFYCRKEVRLEFPSPPPRDMSVDEAKEFGRARARARADNQTKLIEAKAVNSEEPSTEEVPLKKHSPSEPHKTNTDTRQDDGLVARLRTKKHPLESTTYKGVPSPEEKSSMQTASLPVGGRVGFKSLPDILNKMFSPQNELAEASIRHEEDHADDTVRRRSDSEDLSRSRLGADMQGTDSNTCSSSGSTSSTESNCDKEGSTPNKDDNDSDTSSESSEVEGGEYQGRESLILDKKSGNPFSTGPNLRVHNLPREHRENLDDAASSKTEDLRSDDDSGGRESGHEVADNFIVKPAGIFEKTKNTRASKGYLASQGTRVVFSGADSRAKVKVMLGPRKNRSWTTKFGGKSSKGENFDLLGNFGIAKWNHDEATGESKTSPSVGKLSDERSRIVQTMGKQEDSKKRNMHLDRWDAFLDQGKRKKTKRDPDNLTAAATINPNKNAFQRIQSGIQKISHGKGKGVYRWKVKEKMGKNRGIGFVLPVRNLSNSDSPEEIDVLA